MVTRLTLDEQTAITTALDVLSGSYQPDEARQVVKWYQNDSSRLRKIKSLLISMERSKVFLGKDY